MPPPTGYDETGLALFMHLELGNMATDLGLEAASSYDRAVDEAVLTYGVATIALATDIRKLRAIARREAWRLAMQTLAADYNFSADGASYSRKDRYDHAERQFRLAEIDCMQHGVDYVAVITPIHHVHDPFIAYEDEARVLP